MKSHSPYQRLCISLPAVVPENTQKYQIFRMLLLVLSIGTGALLQGWSQETRFRVIDQVDLPEALGGGEGSTRFLEIHEDWIFLTKRPSLLKLDSKPFLRDAQDTTLSPGDLLGMLAERVLRLPVSDGRAMIGNVRYEFSLLDPHLEGSGVEGFPVPDSMDEATRELQEALIALLKNRTLNADRYDWEQQMLSVQFLERWSIDPATLEITRSVESITPVIWQRRETEEGEPVDEAGTGYPVYYKNSLRPVPLRQP